MSENSAPQDTEEKKTTEQEDSNKSEPSPVFSPAELSSKDSKAPEISVSPFANFGFPSVPQNTPMGDALDSMANPFTLGLCFLKYLLCC